MTFIDFSLDVFPVLSIAYFGFEFIRFVIRSEVENVSSIIPVNVSNDSGDDNLIVDEVIENVQSVSTDVFVECSVNVNDRVEQTFTLEDLKAIAKRHSVKGYNLYKKAENLELKLRDLCLL